MARAIKTLRDWSRPLPQPLRVPGIMTLQTLADVRVLLERLPESFRAKATWRYVADRLDEAARGVIDPVDVAVPLQLVLGGMEGVPCRPIPPRPIK
jgi:hypothetical protein